MTAKTEDVSPRLIRPGACSYCGHDPHAGAFLGVAKAAQQPADQLDMFDLLAGA